MTTHRRYATEPWCSVVRWFWSPGGRLFSHLLSSHYQPQNSMHDVWRHDFKHHSRDDLFRRGISLVVSMPIKPILAFAWVISHWFLSLPRYKALSTGRLHDRYISFSIIVSFRCLFRRVAAASFKDIYSAACRHMVECSFYNNAQLYLIFTWNFLLQAWWWNFRFVILI